MQRIHQQIIYSLLFLITFNACSQSKKTPSNIGEIDSLQIEAIDRARHIIFELCETFPSISIAVAKNGKMIWSEAFGYSNVSKKEVAKPSNLYRIYSVTKPITATLVAKLSEEGLLDVNQKVTYYLNDLHNQYKNVKVINLINHTSGIRHYQKGEWLKLSQNNCTNVSDALSVFIDDPLEFSPGDNYLYSSFNYVLLSAVLESAGHKPFDSLLTEYIFRASNIKSIKHDNPNIPDSFLTNFYESRRKVAREVNNSCKWGGGGYNASAEALVRFGIALCDYRIVNQKSFELMLSFSMLNSGEEFAYGYGFGIFENDFGEKFVSHSGSGIGGSSSLRIYPEHGLVIALLVNLESDELKSKMDELGDILRN